MYFSSDSQCNDTVACLTDVKSPSDFSAGVHNLSEDWRGLNFESVRDLLNTTIQIDNNMCYNLNSKNLVVDANLNRM